jgi:hypothetical protein
LPRTPDVVFRFAAPDVFSATVARMKTFNAFSSILSPSWISSHVAFEAGIEEA